MKPTLDTTVHRKPASDSYLYYNPAQAWHKKTAPIFDLRALNYYTTKELLHQELVHITQYSYIIDFLNSPYSAM